jgi:hypothetical protein
MGFNRYAMLQVAEGAASCPLLMSVHMSDNDVCQNYENNAFMMEILNFFNLGE